MNALRKLRIGLTLFFATLSVSVLGYTLAGWSLIDSVYMVVITVFGVGYGEVHPLDTPQLKLFTMGVIVAGASAAIYSFSAIVQLVTQGEIQRALGARRMRSEIGNLSGHVIICGFGRIGQVLAAELFAAGRPFVVLDNNPSRVEQARQKAYLAMVGNATEEESLLDAGIQRATIVATVLPDDALNVFITLTARNLQKDLRIIARGEFPSTHTKLIQAGADQVVLPTMIGAQRIATLINRPATSSLLADGAHRHRLDEDLQHLGMKLMEVTLPPDSPIVGRTASEVEVRGHGVFLIVAIRPAGGEAVLKSLEGVRMAAGDTVILMGHADQLPTFVERNVTPPQKPRYRGTLRGA